MARAFTDADGRLWHLDLDDAAAQRFRERHDCDALDVAHLFGELLSLLCEQQREQAGMTVEQFQNLIERSHPRPFHVLWEEVRELYQRVEV
jgi:hypothetical protein